ncbi:MAG: sulfotransferase [Actinomycetota bacterium]
MTRSDSPLRDRMIFVVGARRSGTNWLQRTLAAHPDIVAVPSETFLFSRGIAPLAERFQHAAPGLPQTGTTYMDRQAFLDAVRSFCDSTFLGLLETLGGEGHRLVERTPEHACHLDLIGDVYPDARILHIIRDGRDVVRSLLSMEWGPESVAEAAEEWRTSVESAVASGKRLPHYREVRYEEMLADPRPHISALFDWLGLDSTPAIIDRAVVEAAVPYNVDPASPKPGSGKWRGALSESDLTTVEQVAGRTLADLGYDLREAPTIRRASQGTLAELRARAERVPVKLRSRGREILTRRAIAQITSTQEVLKHFLTYVAEGRFDAISSVLAPTVSVRIVGLGSDWQGRGPSAEEKLVGVLSSDRAFRGRQTRGDVHSALPLSTVVAAYAGDGGEIHHRVFVVGVKGARIASLTYYLLGPSR